LRALAGRLPRDRVDTDVYRIIPARFPQIDLYERVADPADYEVLYEVESLTNPRLRDEAGDLYLVPREDRVAGPGASYIMAAFTHAPTDGRGGRFNRDFGVFYCTPRQQVARDETAFHRARFLRESRSPDTVVEMRTLRARLGPEDLHDARRLPRRHPIYDPDSYAAGQALGHHLRDARSFGLRYHSVRGEGECFAVFRPRALSTAAHLNYLDYHYCATRGRIVDITPARLR